MQTEQQALNQRVALSALQELIEDVEDGHLLRPELTFSPRGKISKGRPYGRVLKTEVFETPRGVTKERYYHATKGWREIRRVL